MTPKVLILVSSDPRISGRPAEAVRLAAGVGAWKKVQFSLYLTGPALLALQENADELVDGQNFSQYLPMLHALQTPVYVPAGQPKQESIAATDLRLQELTTSELAATAARSQYIMHF
jgi:hypothetical protein